MLGSILNKVNIIKKRMVAVPVFLVNSPKIYIYIAKSIVKQHTREEITSLINEMNDELTHPKQKVKEILDLKADEQDIREYLKLLCEELNLITQ